MANLIIKPTTGGSLILQDEGASAAITVAPAGTTTFAENATFSGTANALGTVTTGNISNTAIVYPDGHILQVAGNSTAQINSTNANTTVISQAITGLDYANNDVLIVASGMIVKTGGTGDYFRGFICGGSLGATTSGEKKFSQVSYQGASSDEENICCQHIDTAPPSANETYSLYVQQLNSATVEAMRWSITVYEIKR